MPKSTLSDAAAQSLGEAITKDSGLSLLPKTKNIRVGVGIGLSLSDPAAAEEEMARSPAR
jgi:hypothetical protein